MPKVLFFSHKRKRLNKKKLKKQKWMLDSANVLEKKLKQRSRQRTKTASLLLSLAFSFSQSKLSLALSFFPYSLSLNLFLFFSSSLSFLYVFFFLFSSLPPFRSSSPSALSSFFYFSFIFSLCFQTSICEFLELQAMVFHLFFFVLIFPSIFLPSNTMMWFFSFFFKS